MAMSFKTHLDGVSAVESPDSGGFSSVYVLGAPQDALIVDAYTAWMAGDLIVALQAAGVRPGGVRAIVVTHGHADHYGGAGALAKWSGAPVWAHLSTALQIEDPRGCFACPAAWSANASLKDWENFQLATGPGPSPRVERILREGDALEHAGMKFDVLSAPGHDRGELVLHERARRLVFTGDLVQGGMDAPKNWLGLFTDPAAQRKSLERVRGLAPLWNFKGHRMPRSGAELDADLASALARLDRLEAALLAALREKSPLTVAGATRAAFKSVLGVEVAEPPNYAVLSVTAFLLDLARRGLARRTPALEWEPV